MRKTKAGTVQYGFQPENTGSDSTRLMTMAFIGMSVLTGALYGYNSLMRKIPSAPVVHEVATRSVPLSNIQAKDPIVTYIKEWAGSRNRTEARKYARTVAVLGQCGFKYRSVRKTFEAENLSNYDILKSRIIPGSRAPQIQGTKLASNEINADSFKLDMTFTQGNTMLAAGAMAQELDNPYPEESFERRPSNDECGRDKAMAQAGEFAVRI